MFPSPSSKAILGSSSAEAGVPVPPAGCCQTAPLTPIDPPSHQDYVYQPFHDVLPYADFSLTLRVRDVPQLLDLLKAVPHDQLMQYRRNL